MKPLPRFRPLAQITVDEPYLVKFTGRRDICNRYLVTAQELSLTEAILKELHRPFEHDLFERKFIICEGQTDHGRGEASLKDIRAATLAEVRVMLVEVHINKGPLTSIFWVPVIGTSPRVGKIAQDSMTLANLEDDLASLLVNFLQGWDLASPVDTQVWLLRVLTFAHGN